MSLFKSKVIEIINQIPYGKVASYGQVAAMAGVPRAARQVGAILNQSESKAELPWWRVINNSGCLTIKGSIYTPADQKVRLEEEGVSVSHDFILDIEEYRYRPDQQTLRKLQLPQNYIEKLIRKFNL